jgi:hypothetical protein
MAYSHGCVGSDRLFPAQGELKRHKFNAEQIESRFKVVVSQRIEHSFRSQVGRRSLDDHEVTLCTVRRVSQKNALLQAQEADVIKLRQELPELIKQVVQWDIRNAAP